VNDIPLGVLFAIVAALILVSAFFSSAETALMRLNLYRLKHMADQGHRAARMAQKMLAKPDRLIGLILLGNNFVNILASALATLIGLRLAGDAGIAASTIVLTIVILIFAEVGPKTYAAYHPQQVALPATYLLSPLSRLLLPLVWLTNALANLFLRVLGIPMHKTAVDALNRDELRSVVSSSNAALTGSDKAMLVNLLDLTDLTVDDIMVPRNEIVGIDLDDDWTDIQRQLKLSYYTRLPLFHGSVEKIQGVVHMRKLVSSLAETGFDRAQLERVARGPYFIPEGTSLARQLLEFQRRERRMAFVVDEYGDILGLVTLDDILEEVVGEFTTEPVVRNKITRGESADTFLVDGGASIKSLNRRMNWTLPVDGPRTLNGLILEQLETIPETGTSIKIADLILTITKTGDNTVSRVKITRIKEQHEKASNTPGGAR